MKLIKLGTKVSTKVSTNIVVGVINTDTLPFIVIDQDCWPKCQLYLDVVVRKVISRRK